MFSLRSLRIERPFARIGFFYPSHFRNFSYRTHSDRWAFYNLSLLHHQKCRPHIWYVTLNTTALLRPLKHPRHQTPIKRSRFLPLSIRHPPTFYTNASYQFHHFSAFLQNRGISSKNHKLPQIYYLSFDPSDRPRNLLLFVLCTIKV